MILYIDREISPSPAPTKKKFLKSRADKDVKKWVFSNTVSMIWHNFSGGKFGFLFLKLHAMFVWLDPWFRGAVRREKEPFTWPEEGRTRSEWAGPIQAGGGGRVSGSPCRFLAT